MISATDIAPLRGLAPDGDTTEKLKLNFRRLRKNRRPFFLEVSEFDEILHWKLGSQYGRVSRHRDLLLDTTIPIVTRAAFEARAAERGETLKIRTGVLTSLPIVGVPVASAILTLVMPEEYGVIDFRGWRQVFGDERRSFSIPDYLRYMRHVWRLAEELSWLPQEVDHAIWEYDRRATGV
jgi:hypothetical protein